MKSEMASILKSVDIEVINSKLTRKPVTKLFGSGQEIGVLLGKNRARFAPSTKSNKPQHRE